MNPASRPKIVDLFAGAGLFSYAFSREGFQIIRAIELDPIAARTYGRNVGDHVETGDVREATPSGRCDVIIAGPPCQGFSTLGRRRPNDPRNALSLEVLRWSAVMKPIIVVIENVSAFLDSEAWAVVAQGLERQGYTVSAQVVNALDTGVAQDRKRSFTFASRVGTPFVQPLAGQSNRTVRDALLGLPLEPDGRNHHSAPKPSGIALARMRHIPPGGDRRDVLRDAPHLAPRSWRTLGSDATGVWGRLSWDRPSSTLRTCLQNASKGRHIHPEQNRVISLREAARIHSIPDWWTFEGQAIHIARQIGNSVPPLLGRAVARAVMDRLRRKRGQRSGSRASIRPL